VLGKPHGVARAGNYGSGGDRTDHNCLIHTAGSDFARFSGIRPFNPLKP